MRVHPLTRRRSDGVPLQRSPHVEAQIVVALALAPQELIQRAIRKDSQAPDSLHEETLVYVIRAYHRLGERVVVNALSTALLRRCDRLTSKKLRALGRREAEEAYQEVICQLFERILDLDSDRGDFLQVRFWVVLERVTIALFRRYMAQINEEKRTLVPLAHLAGADLARDDEERGGQHTRPIPVTALLEPERSIERGMLANDGLNAMQEPYRTAFILRYSYGWDIASNDPHAPTLSKYFNKTPRTIHNWLAFAEKTLEAWRGEPR